MDRLIKTAYKQLIEPFYNSYKIGFVGYKPIDVIIVRYIKYRKHYKKAKVFVPRGVKPAQHTRKNTQNWLLIHWPK